MCATAWNRTGFPVSKMIHDSKQCSSDVTYCLPVRALLDVVVASCHWTTFPTSSSGTQPLHPKVYTNSPKNHLVLVQDYVGPDPGLAAPDKMDFRIQADSPVRATGFQTIPFDKIGLRPRHPPPPGR